MKEFFVNLALLFVTIIFIILATEIVLIIIGYANPLKYDPFYIPSTIDGLFYEHKPNFIGKGRYDKTVIINSIGIRSHREFTITPAKAVKRIAILGDSFSFGLGVDYGQSYANILQEKLSSSRNGATWEVMNFGVNGYSVDKMITTFKAKASKFKPQIVILAILLEDFNETRNHYSVVNGYISSPNSLLSNNMKLQSILRKFRLTTQIKMLLIKAKRVLRNKFLSHATVKSGFINEVFSQKAKTHYESLCSPVS